MLRVSTRLTLFICLACVGLLARSVIAHPISLSSAIVDVQQKQILVEMEIMLEDLVLYHRLRANGEMKFAAEDLLEAAKKHRQFLLDYFRILDASGNRLTGDIQAETLDQIDSAGVPQSELMRRTIRYQIAYAMNDAMPDFLTFMQNFGGDKSILMSVMDLQVLQDGQFIEKSTQIVSGRPLSIKLDWNTKREGKPETFAQLRKKRQEQLRDRLGIASYTGLFSFLYITRFEVRHEILVPLLTLEGWLTIPRKEPDFLDVDEQIAARDSIERFFQESNRVAIDGQSVTGKLSRLNFFSLDINDFALNAEPRKVSVHQARVGVILTFPSSDSPKEVSVQWDKYSEYASYIHSVVLVGDEKPSQHYFQVSANTYQWSGDLIGPKVEPARVKSDRLDESQRSEVVREVLTNVYRAFDFRSDEEVYDALAASVAGNLLRDVYLRIKRSLLMAEQGGAISHVTSVQMVSAIPVSENGTRIGTNSMDAIWRVSGTTEHWGHVHTRVSEYRARLTLIVHEGAWKLEKFQLLDDKRIQFETSIRGYDPN